MARARVELSGALLAVIQQIVSDALNHQKLREWSMADRRMLADFETRATRVLEHAGYGQEEN